MNDHYKKCEPQTIERMQQLMTPEGFQGFCRGNIIKYAERLYFKGTPEADALKIIDYANWLYESLAGKELSYGLTKKRSTDEGNI